MFNVINEIPLDTRNHVCANCGIDAPRVIPTTRARERIVDLGIFIEFEGRIVLCETCVVSLADELGMIRADRHAEALRQVGHAAREIAALRDEVAQLTSDIAVLRRYQHTEI